MDKKSLTNLAVFFSKGAFGDCARHSILHALEDERVGKIRIYSSSPYLLDEKWWMCGCKQDHGAELKTSKNVDKIERIQIDPTDRKAMESLDLTGTDAVISGLGNRQMFLGDRVAKKGTQHIIHLMNKYGIKRLIMMSSMGINSKAGNDKPAMEWRKEGKFMGALFNTICIREYRDLLAAENSVHDSTDIDYVIIRPVGLGEKVPPTGLYYVQTKKFEDVVGANMAKSDVGKFMLDEVLQPSIHNRAIVLGSDPKDAYKGWEES
jgi:hypothetical protein